MNNPTPAFSPEEAGAGERWLLSYYAASEMAGGLLFGKLARWTADGELRARLTWHAAEEMRHAWVWTEALLALGGLPEAVVETYQSRYFAAVGVPGGEIDVLALTHVFETRVAWHLSAHLAFGGAHRRVAQALRTVLADEGAHLGWVRDRLASCSERGLADDVRRALDRFSILDARIYRDEIAAFEAHSDDLRPLAAWLRRRLDTQPEPRFAA
jgi:hypothetical protein